MRYTFHKLNFGASLLGLLLALCLSTSCNKASGVSSDNETKLTFKSTFLLPKTLPESSAIEVDDKGFFWSLNDRGNDAVLFQLSPEANFESELFFISATNNDWEDLAYDQGVMYVGDFGNNDNDRKNLRIFKVSGFDSLSNSKVETEVIEFNLEDQDQFPPAATGLLFDIEAFFAHNEKLYLFTKDRSDPFVGLTKMYELTIESGTQTAILIDTFETSTKKKEGAISSADLSPDGSKMILISEQQIFLFSDFVAPNYFQGCVKRFPFEEKRKYEGVVFVDDCNLALVSETKYGVEAQLAKIGICE